MIGAGQDVAPERVARGVHRSAPQPAHAVDVHAGIEAVHRREGELRRRERIGIVLDGRLGLVRVVGERRRGAGKALIERQLETLLSQRSEVQVRECRPRQKDTLERKGVENRRRQRPAWRWIGRCIRIETGRKLREVDVVVRVVDVERGGHGGPVANCGRVCDFVRRQRLFGQLLLNPRPGRQLAADRAHDQIEWRRHDRPQRRGQQRREAAQICRRHDPDVEVVVDDGRRTERPVERDADGVIGPRLHGGRDAR